MITLGKLIGIINNSEVIAIYDSNGFLLIDSHGDSLIVILDSWFFGEWLLDNNEREVFDVTVVKNDLSLDETTLVIGVI